MASTGARISQAYRFSSPWDPSRTLLDPSWIPFGPLWQHFSRQMEHGNFGSSHLGASVFGTLQLGTWNAGTFNLDKLGTLELGTWNIDIWNLGTLQLGTWDRERGWNLGTSNMKAREARLVTLPPIYF